MPPVELALRTGAAAILLLTGVVILRDRRRMDSKGAGGLLALSVAADSIVAVSGGPSVPGVWPVASVAEEPGGGMIRRVRSLLRLRACRHTHVRPVEHGYGFRCVSCRRRFRTRAQWRSERMAVSGEDTDA